MDTTIQNDNLSAPATVPSKELPKATQIIKNVWNFFKSNFKALWPLFVFVAISELVGGLIGDKQISKNIENLTFPVQALIYFIGFVLSIFSIFVTIAIFKSVFDIKKGQFLGLKNSLEYSLKSFWSYLVISVVGGLVFLGSFALFIVPGLVMALYLCFSVPVLVDENRKPVESMLRSWAIVRDNASRIFTKNISVFFLLSLLYFIVFFLVGFLSAMLVSFFANGILMRSITQALSTAIVALFSTPISIMAIIEIYLAQKAISGDVVVSEELNRSRKNKIIGLAIFGIVLPIAIAIVIATNR